MENHSNSLKNGKAILQKLKYTQERFHTSPIMTFYKRVSHKSDQPVFSPYIGRNLAVIELWAHLRWNFGCFLRCSFRRQQYYICWISRWKRSIYRGWFSYFISLLIISHFLISHQIAPSIGIWKPYLDKIQEIDNDPCNNTWNCSRFYRIFEYLFRVLSRF